MQRNMAETVLGAVVLLVAGAFIFFFYRTTDIAPQSGYQVIAEFDKIDGLDTGSPVRIGGVKVGQVLGFELDANTYRAIVHMSVNDGIKLPVDTSAVITSAGLLDGKFMTLQPGSEDEMLKDGGKIQYTQSTASLEQLLGQVIFSLTKSKDEGDSGTEASPEPSPQPSPAQDTAPAPAPEDHP
ncbi:MAG TPA: outer membrane lipid asymmetry maintenance protein MlaD [Patescibacteria group bacterium]|nr:outer membrane lipid asymmetry maintenance protein MlaD [Patescibacteria group bacterium]